MNLSLKYNIHLSTERNAVPRLKLKFQTNEDWLYSYDTAEYKEKLLTRYGYRIGQKLKKWFKLLKRHYPFRPNFTIKGVQAIFKMAENDSFFKQQSANEFNRSDTFLQTLLASDIDLSLFAFNPIKRTCPVHLMIRLALIYGRCFPKNRRLPRDFFTPVNQRFSYLNIISLFEQFPIEKGDKALIEMYFKQPT